MRYLYVMIALSIAIALRLYPTLLSGLPFSTDAWSPIRNAELILKHTPMDLDSGLLDDYNCYWPANSLFGVVLSLITGLKPMKTMAFGVPLAGALTILIFYALVKKVIGSSEMAFFSSLLLATAYPHALFTAGVTKETYANPLYVLSILIFLNRGRWGNTFLFTVASLALATAHHLAALVTLAVLASMSLAMQFMRVRRGLDLEKFSLLNISILSSVIFLYFWLYAYRGLKVAISLSDLLSAGSYQVVAFTLALYLISRRCQHSRLRTFLTCLTALTLVSTIALLCTRISIVPGSPRLPIHYLLYASPFILASPLAVLGLGELREMDDESHKAPFFWLSAVLGLEGYAVFGDPPVGLVLAYRTLNFLCPPLAFICTLKLRGSSREKLCGPISKGVHAVLILIMVLSSYNLYAAVSLQERYMGYFWLYDQREYDAARWIFRRANQTVAGDVKFSYLLGYFDVKADIYGGLRYLTGKGAKPPILVIYDQMLRNGYVLHGGYSVDLPEGWTEKLTCLSLAYSNGEVKIYKIPTDV